MTTTKNSPTHYREAALTYAEAASFHMFNGRTGHRVGPCVERHLSRVQVAAVMARAYEVGYEVGYEAAIAAQSARIAELEDALDHYRATARRIIAGEVFEVVPVLHSMELSYRALLNKEGR